MSPERKSLSDFLGSGDDRRAGAGVLSAAIGIAPFQIDFSDTLLSRFRAQVFTMDAPPRT
jgi:hypothetical protein